MSAETAGAVRTIANHAARAFSRLLTLIGASTVLSVAQAQITIVNVSAPDPPSNNTDTITIAPPPSIAANDLLLAIVADRGGNSSGVSTVPAGWSLVTSSVDGARLGMYVYRKVATASEPAGYTWSFVAANRSAISIIAFRGVDTTDSGGPIVVSATQINPGSSNSMTAPSVTPGIANTMLVGFWGTINGNAVLTAPASMLQRLFVAGTGAGPNGVAMLGTTESYPLATATGTRVASSSHSLANIGILLALRPGAFAPPAPGGFNAFEPATAAGAITGVIRTKVAGTSFSLAVVALNATRTAVHTSFSGTVNVELLDSSINGGALDAASGCRSSWAPILTVSPNPAFASGDNGRINVGFTVANAWRDVRVRVTYTNGSTTVVGCSTDNFAIRPSSLDNVQTLDASDTTAGLVRALNNSNAASGVVHRAGRAFSVLAQAVSATGTATSGYSGTPTLVVGSCVQPAGCGAGTLTSVLTGNAGAITGTASYSEAGVISATLQDADFAAVDAADSSLAERTITSSAVTIGRFVPDAYQLSVATAPQFAAPVCGAGPARQTFNFVGQPFSFGTAPVVLATPLNAAGAALTNARPRFVAGHLTYPLSAAAAPTALAGTTGIVSIAHSATSLITFDAGSFSFTRNATPVASFVPTLSMTVNLADTTENATAGNSTISALSPLTIAPIGFGSGAGTFHYGRAQLRSTYGDVRRELYVPLEVLRYNGLGWVALPEMANCLIAAPTAFAYSNATGLLTSGGGLPNCASRVASTVTTSNGRAAIRLDRPGGVTTTAASAMTMTLNLLAAPSGASCSGATPVAASTVNAPWLANPDGSNPSARLTWGRNRGELLGLRERFD